MALEGPSTSGAAVPSGRPEVKLFLGGLSWDTTEDRLRQHFRRYGEVADVTIMIDRLTGKPRGFGFLTFVDEDAAERACIDTHILDGRQIDAKRSVPQEQKPKSKKVFVGGLAPDTADEQFKLYFERYGAIAEAQIMQDHTTGRSRGFGFITYEDDSSVDAVFAAGQMHDLAGKKVEVKPATPRGSGPQGRGGGPPPDRPAFRGPPPSPSGRSIGSAFASGTPAAQHPGPYSYSPGAPGMAFAPGPMVNPYTGMGYQMPYYSSMMLQQMGPYAYGTFGYAPQYSSQQQFQLPGQAPPPSPAAFDRQSQLPIGPTGMGPFGPGPGPGYGRGAGPPRFPSGRHGSSS